jgi:hypothetical protein
MWAVSWASTISSADTVAVPALPTATPDASWRKAIASSIARRPPVRDPVRRASVSPAPDEVEHLARLGSEVAHRLPRRPSATPLPARRHQHARAAQSSSARAMAVSTSASVSVGRSVA